MTTTQQSFGSVFTHDFVEPAILRLKRNFQRKELGFIPRVLPSFMLFAASWLLPLVLFMGGLIILCLAAADPNGIDLSYLPGLSWQLLRLLLLMSLQWAVMGSLFGEMTPSEVHRHLPLWWRTRNPITVVARRRAFVKRSEEREKITRAAEEARALAVTKEWSAIRSELLPATSASPAMREAFKVIERSRTGIQSPSFAAIDQALEQFSNEVAERQAAAARMREILRTREWPSA